MNEYDALAQRLDRRRLTRRDTMWLFAASTAMLGGCARSPVTGERILVGMGAGEEREVDRRHSPHQFSQDMGAVQDAATNRYVAEVGQRLQDQVQRRDMPYSYRALNANYINAYTFPAGAMGVTRGLLVELKDESELAALLGHELGHVNARHAAQRQGQALVAQAALIGLAVAASDSRWAPAIGLGAHIGASALLARYSRENEREADALGQDYLVKAGYPAQGMTALHELLVEQGGRNPGLLETMFSSHPMSTERRDTARRLAETRYASSRGAPAQRERFMDQTAALRRIRPAIESCKNGETAMSRKALPEAQRQFDAALRNAPQDYPAHLRMAQCLQAQGRLQEARRYADAARSIYPQEAQAAKLGASLRLGLRDPGGALQDLQAYERLLPGDNGTRFLKGVAYEGLGNTSMAGNEFAAFVAEENDGEAAGYAKSRLKAWGRIK